MQSWLRATPDQARTKGQGLRQALGLATSLAQEWLAGDEGEQEAELLLAAQLTTVLVEGATNSQEGVAKLACSCLLHLARARASLAPPVQSWLVIATARAARLTLHPLHQLMASFMLGSENFGGDIGAVRVAARYFCSGLYRV